MSKCDVIFVLNDKTEIGDKNKQKEFLHLFPSGILETIHPEFVELSKKTKGWNKSVLYVYQDGETKAMVNIPKKDSPNMESDLF